MQESGIGLYYGESFNTFADLGRSIRNRFTNTERQQRRRERREAKRQKRDSVPDIETARDTISFDETLEVDSSFD
jgi:Spy/CpxP family protein refolding chaperone